MNKKRVSIQCPGRNLHRNSIPKGSVSMLYYSSPLANTVGGEVSFGAVNQGSVTPRAKSEILAFPRDSQVPLASQDFELTAV